MRGRAKKDANHTEIVAAIRSAGFSVLDLSAMGRGVPDLIVQTRNGIQLAEVKNPKGSYGKKLSRLQTEWAQQWRGGPVYILRTTEDALNLVLGKVTGLQQSESNLSV